MADSFHRTSKKKRSAVDGWRTLRAASIIIVFVLVVGILLFANFLTNLYVQEGFSGVLQLRLQRAFYWKTLLILIISSLVYTPFSYGISNYFMKNTKACASDIKDVFYLFVRPALLFKAVTVKIITSIMATLLLLVTLFAACVVQLGLLFPILLWQEINLFELGAGWISAVQTIFEKQWWFVMITVILWGITIVALLAIRLRFLFCKYALICFPDFTVWEAIKIGLFATKGRIGRTIWVYIRRVTYYILLFISFGVIGVLLRPYQVQTFSAYASRRIDAARMAYYDQKNGC